MTDNQNPFADFDLNRAIDMRWTLRDIKAKRLQMFPVSDRDLSTLIDFGLIEMRDDVPVLAPAGRGVLDSQGPIRRATAFCSASLTKRVKTLTCGACHHPSTTINFSAG